MQGQQFNIGTKTVQYHGFFSQGYLNSDVNNFLSMKTSEGSFAMTDAGLTLGTQLTDKFRVGGQAYVMDVGKFGNGRVTLDWASGDYSFRDWLGVRAGKVKTVLGLFNDSQDMTFLHPWALLPQSVYPIDLRSDTIAHTGVDLYGYVRLKAAGSLGYTVYGGKIPQDLHGGYVYGLSRSTRHINSYSGTMAGADLRWNPPVKGLLAGASLLSRDVSTDGVTVSNSTPYRVDTRNDHTAGYYAQYELRGMQLNWEYRRNLKATETQSVSSQTGKFGVSVKDIDSRYGYVSAAYRVAKWFQAGAYHSRFYVDWGLVHGNPGNHVFDTTITGRFDVNRYCDLKVEGHFIDGYGSSSSDRGFYTADNPDGRKPNTRMLVIRLGLHI